MSWSKNNGQQSKSGLQELQNRFCALHHVACMCYFEKRPVTQFTYEERSLRFMQKYVDVEAEIAAYTAGEMHELEEVSIENVEKGPVCISFLNFQVEDAIFTWAICGILFDKTEEKIEQEEGIMSTDSDHFRQAVDFLCILTKQLLQLKKNEFLALEESNKNGRDIAFVNEKVKKLEVMNDMIRMSESPREIETVIYEILVMAAEFLEVSGVCLYRLNKKEPTLDLVCEWQSTQENSRKEKMQGILLEQLPLKLDRTYMISSDTPVPEQCSMYFEQNQICALMLLPIKDKGETIFVLELLESRKERIWELEEIKFANEVKEVVQGIVERRLEKHSLTGSYVSLESVLEHVDSAVGVLSLKQQTVLYANEKFKSLLLANETQKQWKELFTVAGNSDAGPFYIEGKDCWITVSREKIQWVDGSPVTLLTIHDVSAYKRFEQQSKLRADIDGVTELYNRKRCEKDFEHLIQESVVGGENGALICIDIDDFKHINTRFGMQKGDELLKQMAERLKRIKGIERRVYRVRSDEFYVIVDMAHYELLEQIVSAIQSAFSKTWTIQDMKVECTASMGVISFPEYGNALHELEPKVEVALYEAKKNGKNRAAYFNADMAIESYKQMDMQQQLKSAVRNGCQEFEVYYQPIVCIGNQEQCHGAEALLRWKSPKLGAVSPEMFIPIAEQLGLIGQLGEFVLHEACSRCKYWNDFGYPEYSVSVNFSVLQFMENNVVDKIKHVLGVTRLNPGNLIVEITETIEVESMRRMNENLAQIKELGVRVALDDFGTGYSSLNHVRELLIDIIKVDQCFAEGLAVDRYADMFVKVVADLASTMNVEVCVEGLENERQLQALKKMNIRYAQGYYYGAPMSKEDFEEEFLK